MEWTQVNWTVAITIANMIATLTILLFQTKILSRQNKITEKQTEIQKNQSTYQIIKEGPKIEIKYFDYRENGIKISLENKGETKATAIGIRAKCYIIKPEYRKIESEIQVNSRGEWDVEKQHSLIDDGKAYSLLNTTTFLFSHLDDYPELRAGTSADFYAKYIHFGLYENKNKLPKFIPFDALINILAENKIPLVYFEFSLVYKNLLNKEEDEMKIDEFAFIVQPEIKKKLSGLTKDLKLDGGFTYELINPYKKNKAFNLPLSDKEYDKFKHRPEREYTE